MRSFQTLDVVSHDAASGVLHLKTKKRGDDAQIALRREGEYVVVSASYGPVEIALRLRYDELRRTLARLQPIGGLQTTRQVGTSNACLSVGRQMDNSLILRPMVIPDATGNIAINYTLPPAAKEALYEWLQVAGE
jgi:hypothetical protein